MEGPAGRRGLTGKVALVTCVSGQVGFEIAEGLVSAGARVHVVHAGRSEASRRVAELQRLGPVMGHVVDPRDELALWQCAAQLNEELPALHVLVVCEHVARVPAFCGLGGPIHVGGVSLSEDLRFATELLPALGDASRQGDPSRVIMVGDLASLGSSMNLTVPREDSRSAGHPVRAELDPVVRTFAASGVNLNFLDIGAPQGRGRVGKAEDPLGEGGASGEGALGRRDTSPEWGISSASNNLLERQISSKSNTSSAGHASSESDSRRAIDSFSLWAAISFLCSARAAALQGRVVVAGQPLCTAWPRGAGR